MLVEWDTVSCGFSPSLELGCCENGSKCWTLIKLRRLLIYVPKRARLQRGRQLLSHHLPMTAQTRGARNPDNSFARSGCGGNNEATPGRERLFNRFIKNLCLLSFVLQSLAVRTKAF